MICQELIFVTKRYRELRNCYITDCNLWRIALEKNQELKTNGYRKGKGQLYFRNAPDLQTNPHPLICIRIVKQKARRQILYHKGTASIIH